jgi:hypothetical protein
MARRRRMHGKRRHKSSCPPFKMHHTEEALLNNPNISVQELEQDHGLSTDTHDLRVLEDGTKVWTRRHTGDIINIPHQIEPMEFKENIPHIKPMQKLEPFDASRYQVRRAAPEKIKPLEAKPIKQPPISKELKTGGTSVVESLPKKRFENKPYYTLTSSGFQIQTSTAIWDEDSKRFKMRPMEPEEIQWQRDQIKKYIGKKNIQGANKVENMKRIDQEIKKGNR